MQKRIPSTSCLCRNEQRNKRTAPPTNKPHAHLRDGIEQTRNDAGGLGIVEPVLLGNGFDEIELGNDVAVILASWGGGREGGRR